MRICFLVNYNLYESKRHFTEHFAEALRKLGVEILVFDTEEGPLSIPLVQKIQAFDPDCIASFNSLLPLQKDGKFFWDFLKIPHLSLLVDPSLYSVDLIKSPYSIISTVDRFEAKYLIDQGFSNIFLLHHAVESSLDFPKDQERPYDVAFLGTCYDHESLRANWMEKNSKEVNDVLDRACERVLSDNCTPIAQAIVDCWNEAELPFEGVDFMSHFYCVDYYTRGKDRLELIQSITDAEVHVFGDYCTDFAGLLDWSSYLSSQSNVTIHKSLPYTEAMDVLKKSKICLNSMPFFKYGSHERMFTPLACGSVPLTMDNLFIDQVFKREEDLLTYASQDKGDVNEKVTRLLADEPKRKEMVARGRAKVMESHTWDVRAKHLLKSLPPILEKVKEQNS